MSVWCCCLLGGNVVDDGGQVINLRMKCRVGGPQVFDLCVVGRRHCACHHCCVHRAFWSVTGAGDHGDLSFQDGVVLFQCTHLGEYKGDNLVT